MTASNSKLEETLAARAASRTRLIELRKDIADKERARARLEEELGQARAQIKREKTKLIELTQECGQLLHADLAGIGGKDVPTQVEQPAPTVT